MKTSQYFLNEEGNWSKALPTEVQEGIDLLLVFASGSARDRAKIEELKQVFPDAKIVGATTAGEIISHEVYKNCLVATAISFDSTSTEVRTEEISSLEQSREATRKAFEKLPKEGLKYIWCFSDGQNVKHANIMIGIEELIPDGVQVFGGFGACLNADYCAVATEDGWKEKLVQVIGFYGDDLEVAIAVGGKGYPFGPLRTATKASDGILWELDGEPALPLIRKYVGVEDGEPLTNDGRNFHFVVRKNPSDVGVVRGFVELMEEEGAIRLGGDIERGDLVNLSMVSKNGLLETANTAAEIISDNSSWKPDLALIVSCISRIMVLGQEIDDEVESACEELGDDVPVTGFYSYGEIGPVDEKDKCSLHNETLSMLVMRERPS